MGEVCEVLCGYARSWPSLDLSSSPTSPPPTALAPSPRARNYLPYDLFSVYYLLSSQSRVQTLQWVFLWLLCFLKSLIQHLPYGWGQRKVCMVNEKGHWTLAVFWNPCCVVGAAGGNSSRGTRSIVHPTQQPFHREELKICGFRSLLYPKRAVKTLLGVGGCSFLFPKNNIMLCGRFYFLLLMWRNRNLNCFWELSLLQPFISVSFAERRIHMWET